MLRFGTDGIRGDAASQLTSGFVFALGRAAATVLGVDRPFVIASDTRESSPRIMLDLAAGLAHEGAATDVVGVAPTPCVAYLAQARGVPGAVVSASHNPWFDNGVKFFAPGGQKLDDDTQHALEAELENLTHEVVPPTTPRHDDSAPTHAATDYLQHLRAALHGRALEGVRVVLDCANGAASELAPALFASVGADVIAVADRPDGRNINERCGSTNPAMLQAAVVEHGATLGVAFDGDADRCLAVDERGALVDGDQMMVAFAIDLAARDQLPQQSIAVTVMSNLGLRLALQAAGVEVVETPVGDRSVLQAMAERGLALGGEQSGHLIFGGLATTGDGMLTGLLLTDLVVRSGQALSNLVGAMTRLPQVLESVPVRPNSDLGASAELSQVVRAVERELGATGRVVLRASGTEPVVRIMVEAPTEAVAAAAVARIRRAVEAAFDHR